MFNVKTELESRGHEVIPFSVCSNRNMETEYARYFVEPIGGRNATYYEDYKKTPRTILQMLARSVYSPQVERAIRREIDQIKPDLVYIIHFINKLSPSVIRGAKRKGLPVVLRLSDYFLLCPRFDFLRQKKVCEDCLTKGYVSCLRHRCVKGALSASLVRVFSMKVHQWMRVYDDVDLFITPSEFLRRKLAQNGFDDRRIRCVPTFSRSESAEEPPLGRYALYLGRITEEKGVETILRAYETLPDHPVRIMGDDSTEEAARLKRYVEEKGMKNVEFTGFRTGAVLEEILRGARFTVIPSIWYDNLPNAALESFRHFKPAVVSDIGSLPELVQDGVNGLLFAPGDPDALREKVLRMDDDQAALEMGRNARRLFEDKYSAEAHCQALLGAFDALIDAARAGGNA
jgi:glycosyltransferase involved in cell wall biosynthesis